MARAFNDGANQYLRVTSSPVSGEPLTLACWFRTDDVGADQVCFSVGEVADVDYHALELRCGGDPADPLWAKSFDGSAAYAASTTSISVNTWHHGCGVFAAADDRRVYLDAGGKNTEATNKVVTGTGAVAVGATADSSPYGYLSGYVAEAAVWDVALTDAEVAVLAAGYSPLFVRPASLVGYWPLIRDTDDDIVGGYSMTPQNGPTVVAHPPVIYPGRMLLGVPAAAPAAVALPVLSGEGVHSLVFGGVTVR